MNNRLTVNAGVTTTVNLANLATNINAGTTMNLNLAPSVTYQVADTLTTGPGRVYSANRTYNTVGLDSIKFVAGLDGAERTKCLAGWKGLTFAAATFLGMAASIVPAVYNYFSPENSLDPKHQAIGAYGASFSVLLSYWLGSRAFDGFDMAVPRQPSGKPSSDFINASNRFGKAIVNLDGDGFSVYGSRLESEYDGLTGAEREGTRPYISVCDGHIIMHAEEGNAGRNYGEQQSSIEMTIGQVRVMAGLVGSEIFLGLNGLKLHYGDWTIRFDKDSLQLGSMNAVQTGKTQGCSLAKINDETVDVTSPSISLHASGARAIFEERGAMIASESNTICVDPGGIWIEGKQLKFDSGGLIHWG